MVRIIKQPYFQNKPHLKGLTLKQQKFVIETARIGNPTRSIAKFYDTNYPFNDTGFFLIFIPKMIVKIGQTTVDELEQIAKDYNLQVEIVDDQDYKFQEEAIRIKRLVKIRSFVNPEHFDYLFRQIKQNYQINRNQDMFVFNLFHGIGHFELNLWKREYDDPIVGRLENLEHDKKVNEWAYRRFAEWKTGHS